MNYDDTGYDRIDSVVISESRPRARKARRCDGGNHQIDAGEVYVRRAGLSDGDFYVTTTCQHCDAGYPRPGSPKEAQWIAEGEAMAAEEARAGLDG